MMEMAPLRLLLIHSVAYNVLPGTHASNFEAGKPSRFSPYGLWVLGCEDSLTFSPVSFKDYDFTFGALFQLPLFAYGVRQGCHR